MTRRESELAAVFNAARSRLVNVAYAVLGSHSEAEDVVSDCWLRLVAADAGESVRDIEGWSTVVVARAAVDTLRSARKRRELYVGPWLPEPRIGALSTMEDPAERVSLDDSVRYALLVVLESLSPAERTAWVLHDLFGLTFDEIAEAVGRSTAAVRQLASRARVHIEANAPRVDVSRQEHDVAVQRFFEAAAGGDLAPLLHALDPNVVLTSDGGGIVNAALQPIVGADKVGRFLVGLLTTRMDPDERVAPITINGELGVGAFSGDQITTAVAFTFDGERLVRIDIVRTPEKLPCL